jgi:signal transduction histidine kinase
VDRLASLARRYGLDLLVMLLTGAAIVEYAVRRGSENAPSVTPWFGVPALALMVVPFFARRRYPFGGPAAYWIWGAALSFADGRLVSSMTSVFVLGMAAAFLLGNLRDGRRAQIGLAIVLGGAATVVVNIPGASSSELVFIPLLFGICWLAGFALRERAEQVEAAEERASQAEREREAASRVAVAEERARIARELHDIVAHAVSVMVLQSGAVRHKLPAELAEDAEALRGVEQTGRTALAEMRRLLGALRADGDGPELAPRPGLDGLEALLADVAAAGLPVELHVEGERTQLPPAIDVSAYRIVQEGLTNALRHSGAQRADVTIRYRPAELAIEILDNGAGDGAGGGSGLGLVGVRERVKIYGGEMSAGRAPEGGFVLRARLPLGEGRP